MRILRVFPRVVADTIAACGPDGEGRREKEWKALARQWSRDRVIYARMEAKI